MSSNHITFQMISDLYDDEIRTRTDREAILKHIATCKVCALEYERLGKTLQFCSQFSSLSFPLKDFSLQTLGRIRSAKRRKQFLKSLPAMAASLLIITGVGLYNARIIGVRDQATIVDEGSRRSYNDSEQVIDIIRQHKATIYQVTDEYVEGTVPVSSFNELRRNLGSRKVAYILMEESEPETSIHWGNAIEEVGLDEGQLAGDWEPVMKDSRDVKKIIRFRVFR
jgi:hypothetical protein